MAPTPESQDWRSIAAKASEETDDQKLLLLVEQLCSAFDESHKPPESEHAQNSSTSENQSHLRKPTANY